METLGPKSNLEMKTKIVLINKLSKDPKYKEADEAVLLPIWESLTAHFSDYKNLQELNKEQVGILMWSFGHSGQDVVNNNFKLWNTFEVYITQKIGLNKFNNFNLS